MNEKIAEQIKQVIISELMSFRWDILGIIDEKQNIFPMTSDTKVLSKVFEITYFSEFISIIVMAGCGGSFVISRNLF